MDDESPDLADNLAEWVRVALIFGLLAVDLLIIYEQVKDRPDFVIWRDRITKAIVGPFQRRSEQRRAEKHVVFEAMEALTDQEAP